MVITKLKFYKLYKTNYKNFNLNRIKYMNKILKTNKILSPSQSSKV